MKQPTALLPAASAAQIISYLPDYPLLSSEIFDWNGFIARIYRFPPAEAFVPALTDDTLIIKIGSVLQVERALDGRRNTDLVTTENISLIPRGVPSWWRWQDVSECLHLHIQPDFCRRLAERMNLGDAARYEFRDLFAATDPLVQSISQTLIAEMRAGAPSGTLYAESLAHTMTVHLLCKYTSVNSKDTLLQPPKGTLTSVDLQVIYDYIEEHLSETISLDQLADLCHLSAYHFARLFKQKTGYAPYQYVLARRLERAKKLLKATNLTTLEIAQQTGFADQSHLARHFRRSVGIAPLEYRQR
jgi:AraC family transcriptional regulator